MKLMYDKLLFPFIIFILLNGTAVSQVNWSKIKGPYGGNIDAIYSASNGNLFVVSMGVLYRSTDNGEDWSKYDNINAAYNCVKIAENKKHEIFVGGFGQIFKSADMGESWEKIVIEGSNLEIIDISCYNDNIVALESYLNFNNKIYYSDNGGKNWERKAVNFARQVQNILMVDSITIVATSWWDGVLRSTNKGISWREINSGLNSEQNAKIVSIDNGLLLASAKDIYFSDNIGNSWEVRKNNLSTGDITAMFVAGNRNIYVGTEDGDILVSSDTGFTWKSLTENDKHIGIKCITVTSEGCIFAGLSPGGVIRSCNSGETWEFKSQNINNYHCTSLVIDSSDNIYLGSYEGVIKYNAQDETWRCINNGLTKREGIYSVQDLAQPGDDKIFAALYEGIYLYDETGDEWKLKLFAECTSIFIDKYTGNILVGTFQKGLYLSVDGGNQWSNVYKDQNSSHTEIRAFTQNSSGRLFAASDKGLLSSEDSGNTWSIINPGLTEVHRRSMTCSSSGILFAGTFFEGIIKSTDNGLTWSKVINSNQAANVLISNESGKTFASGSGGVFEIKDNGNKIESLNSGLTSTEIIDLAFDSNMYLYAGTYWGELFRSNSPITSIEVDYNKSSFGFGLEQNYPNPFNPTTTIKYNIPTVETLHATSLQNISLKVYDIHGREVATLVNEQQSPGYYEVQFDGSRLASGIYLYKLQAGSYSFTKKLILLK